MSELNLMNPGNTSPTRLGRRSQQPHFDGGCSPGKLAKDDKPTKVKVVPRPGLPVML